MTPETIERLAREADLIADPTGVGYFSLARLEDFAALVRAEALAFERARWVKACRLVGASQHAATGAENLRAAHFSAAVACVQLEAVKDQP